MGENHFAYPWFEKCHLTHLRYVFINLHNPPRSLLFQKHILTPKQNIRWIKTPKTQKRFERETWGTICLFFVVWSVWRGRKHLFYIIEVRQGMCDCCSSRPTHIFVSVLDLGFQILFKCELTVWKSKFVLHKNRVLLICLYQVVISWVHMGICAMSRVVFWEQVWVCIILGGGSWVVAVIRLVLSVLFLIRLITQPILVGMKLHLWL